MIFRPNYPSIPRARLHTIRKIHSTDALRRRKGEKSTLRRSTLVIENSFSHPDAEVVGSEPACVCLRSTEAYFQKDLPMLEKEKIIFLCTLPDFITANPVSRDANLGKIRKYGGSSHNPLHPLNIRSISVMVDFKAESALTRFPKSWRSLMVQSLIISNESIGEPFFSAPNAGASEFLVDEDFSKY